MQWVINMPDNHLSSTVMSWWSNTTAQTKIAEQQKSFSRHNISVKWRVGVALRKEAVEKAHHGCSEGKGDQSIPLKNARQGCSEKKAEKPKTKPKERLILSEISAKVEANVLAKEADKFAKKAEKQAQKAQAANESLEQAQKLAKEAEKKAKQEEKKQSKKAVKLAPQAQAREKKQHKKAQQLLGK